MREGPTSKSDVVFVLLCLQASFSAAFQMKL
jgi:hypothetical protein